MGQIHFGYKDDSYKALKTIEVIKEVIIEKIVEVPVDKIIEKLVYVDKIIEVIKEIPVTITHHIEVPVEKEIIKIVEVIKEVPIYTEKFIDVPRDVIKEVITKITPSWVYPVIGLQSLALVLLVLFK